MTYSGVSRLTSKVLPILLLAGFLGCKGYGPKEQSTDTMTVRSDTNSGSLTKGKDTGRLELSTLPDGTEVFQRAHTVVRLGKGFNKVNRDVDLDGDAVFIIRHFTGKPFIVHTRNLVITVLAEGTYFHVDAFASSPGEQVDLLGGNLRIIKSYHSSTDNEPETLSPNEMVMINRDIDLMEKEKLEPAERKAVERKFLMPPGTIPGN